MSGEQSAIVEAITSIRIIGSRTTIRDFTFVSSLAKPDMSYASSA